MMRKLFFAFLVVCIYSSVYSQTNSYVRASEILDHRGEVFIEFKASADEISGFTKLLSVDNYDGKLLKAYANKKQFELFSSLNREFNLVEDYYRSDKAIDMATSVAQMSNWDKYPTYSVYVEMMEIFASSYPSICKLDTIGYSGEGRLILVLKISDNVNDDEAEPEFLYTGVMHGDETTSGILFLRLADYLLANYGSDTQVDKLVDGVQIYINPFANPDGTYNGGNNTVADATRSNAAGIDLNRNYPDFIAGEHSDGEEHGAETLEFIEFASLRNFVMSANGHGGAELLNYPYDTESMLPADDDWWVMVCREYADHAQDNSPNGYLTQEDNGITNGYAWYTATGTRQDYMNYYEYCKEVTLELSNVKLLDSEDLPDHWDYNKDALLGYLEQVTYGLSGIVTDSITHEPLKAKVFIDGYDFLNSHVYSFPEYGDYYRLLNEGSYTVTYSCDGYKSKTFDVNISNYQQTIQDAQLVNLESIPPFAAFSSSSQAADCSSVIEFKNLSEASLSTTYLWNFGDGATSIEENPTHSYYSNGIYTVSLTAENEHGEDVLIKEEYINVSLSQFANVPDYVICDAEGSVEIEVSGSGEILWFNNVDDEVEFHTGSTYTTPSLTETTVYYVQDMVSGEEFTGSEPNNAEGGEYVNDDNYLVFDCMQECILQSVKLYADGAGNRIIYIKDSEGQEIYSEEIYLEDGQQTVELNIALPVGDGLKMGANSDSGLYRGSVGMWNAFDYPFVIGDFISINESNTVYWNDSKKYYAYFYNWTIKDVDCYSERTPLSVYVNETATAGFDFSANSGTVSFTNSSEGVDTYLWDFGDETTSTEVDPVHVYSEDGSYTVTLTATSDCGSDEVQQEVVVTTSIDSETVRGLDVFPNPTDGFINIISDKEISNIIITDISGRVVMTFNGENRNDITIDTEHLPSGIYMLKLVQENNTIVSKIIKN